MEWWWSQKPKIMFRSWKIKWSKTAISITGPKFEIWDLNFEKPVSLPVPFSVEISRWIKHWPWRSLVFKPRKVFWPMEVADDLHRMWNFDFEYCITLVVIFDIDHKWGKKLIGFNPRTPMCFLVFYVQHFGKMGKFWFRLMGPFDGCFQPNCCENSMIFPVWNPRNFIYF